MTLGCLVGGMRGYLRNEENLWWKLSSIEKEVEKTTYVQEEEEEKMKKSLWKRAGKTLKKMERDFSKTPLARAARGKRTRGFI